MNNELCRYRTKNIRFIPFGNSTFILSLDHAFYGKDLHEMTLLFMHDLIIK